MVQATPKPSLPTLSPVLTRSDTELVELFFQLAIKSDVADLLEISYAHLKYILYQRRDRLRYHRFEIPKRDGTLRTISAPPPALRILQAKLNAILQLAYKPKPCVHGFVKGRSILTNAAPHAAKNWVLNVDLKDFFPTIHFGRVRGALMAAPYRVPNNPATIIAQICTADGVLPQGAPSSPILANIVCGRLDGDLSAMARRYRLSYTRYCDDLSFSCRQNSFPADIASGGSGWIGTNVNVGPVLEETIKANGFTVNPEKTRLQIVSNHQEVTGLTVNVFPNVTREYIRQLRGMLYAWKKHGLSAAAATFVKHYASGNLDSGPAEEAFLSVARGRLEYIGMIRGRRDPVYCKLRTSANLLDPAVFRPAPTPTSYRLPIKSGIGDRWTRQFERMGPSVFQLEVVHPDGSVGLGTTFAILPGTLATAAHNLSGTATVRGATGTVSIKVAQLHKAGPKEIDVAMLPHVHGAPCIPFERRLPAPGEEIGVIGFASMPRRHPGLGLYVGTVESLRMNYSQSITFIQVSIASGGGLSGAPLFDARGRVIGVVVESVYEQTAADVPHREYCTVLPIQHLLDIDHAGPLYSLPLQIP